MVYSHVFSLAFRGSKRRPARSTRSKVSARRSSASTRSPVRTIRKRSSASAWSAYTRSKAFPCIAMMMAEKKIRDQRQVSVRSLV
jgi:hypothetical protein